MSQWVSMFHFNVHRYIQTLNNRFARFFICCCCSFIYFHCTSTVGKPSDVLVNPVDPLSPVFTPPVDTIISAPDPLIPCTSPDVDIQVKGNIDAVEFSFKLDSYDWSSWQTSTTIVLTDLDEGKHHCSIRALHRDHTTIEQNPPSVDFTVHAVTGPALMFSSRKKVVSGGINFNYYIVAEEVQNLYGVKLVFTYDNTSIIINSITSGSIPNVEVRLLEMKYSNEARAEMFFPGDTPIQGITGSDTIIVINCTPIKAGTSVFTFIADSVLFRDANNAAIPVNQLVNGKIVVK